MRTALPASFFVWKKVETTAIIVSKESKVLFIDSNGGLCDAIWYNEIRMMQ